MLVYELMWRYLVSAEIITGILSVCLLDACQKLVNDSNCLLYTVNEFSGEVTNNNNKF
jgi:hypothetical protein